MRHPAPSCAVAVSGGADSLLTLLLLQEAGVPTHAVHGRFLPPNAHSRLREERLAAVCAARGITLTVLDLTETFARTVVQPFVRDYAAGRTPNPCATCNPTMKWGVLWEEARALGATTFATGHYACAHDGMLLRGADPTKDQSYFLAMVSQERLRHTLLPLGGRTKAWVRAELARRGITPPEERESQDICFVPGTYHDLMAAYGVPGTPGPIVLADGTPVGRHQGLWRFTIGQRRGLGIAYREPLFVIAKDPATNTVIVGPKSATLAWGCRTQPANFLAPPTTWPQELLVQTSFRQKPQPARVTVAADQTLTIRFQAPGPRPTPGQLAAVYHGDRVLAGAIIHAPLEAV